MNQHLSVLLFFTGVLPVLPVPLKYYLIQPGQTWSDAVAYCKAKHVDIATSDSYDNLDKIQAAAQSQQFSSGAWIGLYDDINSWRWSMGNEPLGNYTKWFFGRPKANYPLEGCLVTSQGQWWDKPCTTLYPFMCYDDRNNGTNKFVVYNAMKTWPQAQSYCRQYHTDLASMRNSTEASIIMSKFGGSIWVGMHRDAWKWEDNSNKTNFMWAPGEPNNAGGLDYCGYINNSQTFDGPCTTLMPFFCYRVITGQQQIIKVKIQSDQDVNILAVKAAILNMIKQKLMDLGIAEVITVTFRKQPNGNVFKKIN